MGTQPNALELAKQGNVKAIAALINRILQPHGVTASVRLNSDCLYIMLDAVQVRKQQTMVRFVYSSVVKLKIASVRTLKIYGRQLGQDFPAWGDELGLPSPHWPEPLTPNLDRHPAEVRTQWSAGEVDNPKPNRGHQKQIGSVAIAQPNPQSNSLIQAPIFKWAKFPSPLGRVLIAALTIQISVDSLMALFALVGVTTYAADNALEPWDSTMRAISLDALIVDWIEKIWDPLRFFDGCILWTTMGLFLVWLYYLQIRFKAAFPQYPITPWGAIARFALPFYNFWGIWNLWATLAHHLKSWRQTARWGYTLRRQLPWYYAIWLVIWILERTDWIFSRLSIAPALPLWFYLALHVISLMLSTLALRIVWIIHQATSRLKPPPST